MCLIKLIQIERNKFPACQHHARSKTAKIYFKIREILHYLLLYSCIISLKMFKLFLIYFYVM